jgi:hypothetical protein
MEPQETILPLEEIAETSPELGKRGINVLSAQVSKTR